MYDYLASLQRAAGNRAVSSLPHLLPIQRQSHEAERPRAIARSESLDPELAAELQDLFPNPTAPGFEAMTTSTGAQTTAGELTTAALRLWRRERIDLTTAYRLASSRETLPASDQPGRRIWPASGGTSREGAADPRLRWGLLLAVWDYQSWEPQPLPAYVPADTSRRRSRNLPDIRRLLESGSPFQKAAASSYDRHDTLENPDAQEMVAAIYATVDQMSSFLQTGEQGHLTVNYQGHGGGGTVFGADGQGVSRGTLRTAAEYARELDVQVTYVLDTCNAGSLAVMAENQELALAAAASTTSQRERLRARGSTVMALIRVALQLNDCATDLYGPRLMKKDKHGRYWETMDETLRLIALLRELSKANPRIQGLPVASLLAFDPEVRLLVLRDRQSLTRQELDQARVRLAPVLSQLNRTLAREVRLIRAELAQQVPSTHRE